MNAGKPIGFPQPKPYYCCLHFYRQTNFPVIKKTNGYFLR